jgi:Protein of unknown function (DUF2652)
MATREREHGPRLTAADSGSLVLADISGYTSYLLGTELEHAQDVLSDLMAVVVGRLQPPLTVTKLEGDAIFAYALDGTCGASTLLDTIEQSYFAFRARQRDIAQATSCTCAACQQIPTLDLKFLVHHGSFVRRSLAGNEELTGRDVIVIHRLSKNSAAKVLETKGYALLTEAATTALGLEPQALGLREHVETYDHVGEVRGYLDDLGERWTAELERSRFYVTAEDATFERSLTLPVDVLGAWEWLTLPERRSVWQADAVQLVSSGGREGVGATNHCMHGPDVIVEHVADWQPFEYFTMRYELPLVGQAHLTTELIPEDGRTTVVWRGEKLEGERLEAWDQVGPMLLSNLDHAVASLSEHLANPAIAVGRTRTEATGDAEGATT